MSEVGYISKMADADLVERSIDGQREAFTELVNRHKSAACGVAYSICGDVGLSEDVAQEAFVSAWGKLEEVERRSGFRSWVCGIARNMALSLVRKRSRRGEGVSLVEESVVDETMAPDEAAISSDQLELLWNSIYQLPENYREPLVLFYRENHSVASVASALDLSEEAARQRLSRGRTMLREGLAKHIEDALIKTRPGMVFTVSVMNALPPVVVGIGVAASASSAKAASSGGVGVAKAGSTFLGSSLISSLVAGVIGLYGFFLLYKYWKAIKLPKDVRQLWLRALSLEIFISLLFSGFVVWFSVSGGHPVSGLPIGPVLLMSIVVVLYMVLVHAISAKAKRRSEECFGEEHKNLRLPKRYQSKLTIAGLPFVSLAQGADPLNNEKLGVAKGWIAIGDCAIGVIAIGGVAIGPISIGGLCVGLLAIGGNAIGLLVLGGVVAGIYAGGGIAIGWDYAFGGMAIAKGTSVGGMAVASNEAMGGLALAPAVIDYADALERFAWLNWFVESGANFAWLLLMLVPLMVFASRMIDKVAVDSSKSK